jgi:hypothetical protein
MSAATEIMFMGARHLRYPRAVLNPNANTVD